MFVKFLLLGLIIGLGDGKTIQQLNPVYNRPSSIINSSPIVSTGKSLSNGPPNLISNGGNNLGSGSSLQPTTVVTSQPMAEERESGIQASDAANIAAIGSAVSSLPSSQSSPGSSQTFRIVYIPNASETSSIPTQGINPNYQTNSVAYTPQNQLSLWDKYHVDEILVGIISLACVVGGGALLYAPFSQMRSRALRSLGFDNLNSEDVSLLTKNVLKAVERLYEINKAE